MTDWTYAGDVNPEYGGIWFKPDPQDWKWGYMECVRVTDLDSGCGFTGAVLIERVTAMRPRNRQQWRNLKECCDFTMAEIAGNPERVAEAAVWYGLYDPVEDFGGPHQEVLQLEADGPMTFDGWEAARRQTKGDLAGYIEAKWLD